MFASVEEPTTGLAGYIRRLGGIVSATLRSRGLLLNELKRIEREEPEALPRAGRIAGQCAEALDEALRRVSSLPPLAEAQSCTIALRQWIALHVQACDLVTLAAGTGDEMNLRRAKMRLRDAALTARQFNLARRMLIQRVDSPP